MQPNEATAGPATPSASARDARIGLLLVVATAAIATLVVLATILPGGLGGPRADAQRADDVAVAVAGSFRADLSSAVALAGDLAGDPTVGAILAKPAGARPPAPPASVADAADELEGAAPQVVIADAHGAVRLAFTPAGGAPTPDMSNSDPVALGAPPAVLPVVVDGQGNHRIGVLASIGAGPGKGGSVLISVSIEAVLRSSSSAGAALELVGPAGARIAHSDPAPATGPGGADPSAATVTATSTRALAGLPAGFPAWSLVVRLPIPTSGGSGEPLPILLALAAVLGCTGILGAFLALRPAGRLATTSNELQRKFAEVAEQAYLDVMTGLGNQRSFQVECDRQLEFVRRGRLPLTLVVLDLDDFKRINDTDGHKVGDELLSAFAQVIEGCIRRSDRAFRIGGDEFAILMPGTDADGAQILTRRLLASALEPPAGNSVRRRAISFSGGIAQASPKSDGRIELFSQADAAMYWSKRHGRTLISIFDPEKHPLPTRVSADLASAVAEVIEHRSVRAVFQPIVQLATGRVIGYEGLVRPTAHPFMDAGSMFAAAEGGGRTAELDYVCLETVAAAAASIPADRYVAINLSPRTLEAPEFNALALCRRLARLGLPSQRIVLELTEREEIEDLARLRRGLEACRALGVRVAADDVGAGNAGLRLLSLVPFDVVKIDLSLVQDAVTHETSAEILATLRDLATRRGAVVVAEGLETQQQLKLVLAAGIDAGQGYLLGRPGEATDAQPIDMERLLSAEVRFGASFVEHTAR
ncbi:MAG TPA: EAL domain-containing protein [Candidatus Limnocylindrales bacterium]